MRLAVVEFTGRSGMIHYAFQLCRGLSAAGADVTLITDRHHELADADAPFAVERLFDLWDPKPHRDRDPTAIAPRLRTVARRGRRGVTYYRQWARLREYLDRTRPHVVQFGDIRFPGDLLPLSTIRRAGHVMADICHNVRPYSSEGRGAGSFRSDHLRRSFYRRIYRQFDHVFVHHDVNRREFLTAYEPDPRRVSAIPHGNESLFSELWDTRKDERELRQRLHLEPESRVILLFGTLSRYKGADILLRAFARVRRSVPQARLVIAGYPLADFDLEAHRDLSRRLAVSDAVRFYAEYVPSDEVFGWMRLADVAVYPYRDVFQSGALQVALTAGVPVVASRVGAMEEVVRDGVEGVLVPTGDVEALAAAIERVLKDRRLAATMGRSGEESARTRFAWDDIGATLLATYDGLAGNGSRPR